jgi:hypothetical protein
MNPVTTAPRDYWSEEKGEGLAGLSQSSFTGRQAEICRLALEALPPLANPSIVEAQVRSSVSAGHLRGYAISANGTPVSQSEFAALYVAGMNRLRDIAERLILEQSSVEELVALRQAILEEVRFAPLNAVTLPSQGQWRSVQSAYEEGIRHQICVLPTVNDTDPELRLRATELAIMSLRLAHQQVDGLSSLDAGGCERYAEIRDLHRVAQERSGGDVIAYLEGFMSLVRDTRGYVPELHVWSDYDGNLSVYPEGLPESGGPWKPGELTNGLINSLDKLAGYHLRHRLVMTEFPGIDVERRKAAEQLLLIACSISKVFSDTPRFFDVVNRAGGAHRVLTANHWSMVHRQMSLHGLDACSQGVVGVRSDYHYTSKADLLLNDLLRREKIPVVFFGEDNNSGIVNHIRTGMSLAQKARGLHLDLGQSIFFAAREPDDIANFAISGALKERRIPHVLDRYDSRDDTGKACSIAFVEAYIRMAARLRM